jgi:hypothetical protein
MPGLTRTREVPTSAPLLVLTDPLTVTFAVGSADVVGELTSDVRAMIRMP